MTQEILLQASNISAGYNGHNVFEKLSVSLFKNEVLCLIGHNGAGKSTLLKSLFNILPITSGSITYANTNTQSVTTEWLTVNGMSMVPEGRGIFPSLNVEETLTLGLWAAKVPKKEHSDRLDWITNILPKIKDFYHRPAGNLSGGQQQMVSLARSLLSKPKCLLLDEPSIGLAPKLFQDLMEPISNLQKSTGMSILIVEQNVKEALKISDRVVVMKSGSIIKEGLPEEFSSNTALMELY